MKKDYQLEYQHRLKKLEQIRHQHINPYPSNFDKKDKVSDIKTANDSTKISTAGRIMTIRKMGQLIFCHIQDQFGRAQIALKKDEINVDKFKFFQKYIDMADFVGVSGQVFTTNKGEKTLLVKDFELLSKALLPLPEKWHGLKDEEEKFRKRYLDILVNQDTKDMILKKNKYHQSIRDFLSKRGFIEVETPVLENTTGGADARPFITRHNALDIDLYLRISVGELWQKRLMIAGLDKTFEIGRIFRNEGMDAEHLQDYTSMEFYWAYADWQQGMDLVEKLVKYVAKQTFGTLKFNIRDFEINLDQKWQQYDYRQEILNRTGIEIETADIGTIKKKLNELKVEYEDFNNLARGIDQLWKYCRKQISGPGFLVYPPKSISPLAKESSQRPGYVERYWLILAGSELCNGYSELNDPLDQEKRFTEQSAMRQAGDEEAQMHDTEFVTALKHGMPPTTGLGISERLFAFLADKPMRECQLFPLMRPKTGDRKVGAELAPAQDRATARVAPINPKAIAGVGFALARQDQPTPDLGLNYDQAKQLVDKYITKDITKLHLIESEAIMRALARHFNQDEDKWGIIGLLHDIDWDLVKTDPKQHTIKAVKILKDAGASKYLIDTILSHTYGCADCGQNQDKKRTSLVEHCLAAAETITGLIIATALVQPDKKLNSVKLSSLKKKFKQKSFAANCNRDIIMECEKIGFNLDQFLEISLKALQNISDQLGL